MNSSNDTSQELTRFRRVRRVTGIIVYGGVLAMGIGSLTGLLSHARTLFILALGVYLLVAFALLVVMTILYSRLPRELGEPFLTPSFIDDISPFSRPGHPAVYLLFLGALLLFYFLRVLPRVL